MLKSPPSLKDLSSLVTPNYGAKWKIIGNLLNLKKGEIEIIEHDYRHSAVDSCTAMWEKWLDQDTNACWGNLLKVLEETENIYSVDHIIKGKYFL